MSLFVLVADVSSYTGADCTVLGSLALGSCILEAWL